MKILNGILALLVVLISISTFATSKGVCVSGGDTKGSIDQWRQENVTKACQELEKKGVDCETAFTESEAIDKLKSAVDVLECGDTLVIYLMGHGGRGDDGLFFPNAKEKKAKFLTAKEILEAIDDLKCCVNVYVGVHSCFSGQFVDRLKEDIHIKCIVTSSSKTKKAHKKPSGSGVNPRNWPDGFVDGLKKGGSIMESFQEGAKNGKKKAEETGGNKRKGYFDGPLDLKRAHIKKVDRTDDGTIIELDLAGVAADTIFLPKDAKGNMRLKPKDLEFCMDVVFEGPAAFDEKGRFTPETFAVEGMPVKVHVIRVVDREKKKVEVYVLEPEQQRGYKTIILEDLPEDAEYCKWYTAKGFFQDGKKLISGTDPQPTTSGTYTVRAHVQGFDAEKGEIDVELRKPSKKKVKVKLEPDAQRPENLVHCMMIRITGTVEDNGINDATSVSILDENVRMKIISIDGECMKVRIEKPSRLAGKEVKYCPKDGRIPAGSAPGKTVIDLGAWDGTTVTGNGNGTVIGG